MNRKDFIKSGLLLSGLGLTNNLSITEKDKYIDPFGKSIKITDVKCYHHPNALFVKIETNEGISGWGEGDHDNVDIVIKTIYNVAKPLLIGENPFESEYLMRRIMYLGEDLGTSGLLTGAMAGIDNALWDLKGKILGKPVFELLGGMKVDKVKVYASYARGEADKIKPVDVIAKEGAQYVEEGYDTVKIRMQIRTLHKNPHPDSTDQYVSAVRKAIGDKTNLFVDFNNGYTAGKAIPLIQKLVEKYNVALVEEPVSYHDYRGLRQVVEATNIDIAAGEHEFNRYQFRDLIVDGNPDIVNCDVIKGAGITEMRKAAILADAFGKEVMCHSTRPSLGCAAMLHLVASIPNAARIQEYGGPRLHYKMEEIFENIPKFENGYLKVPGGPGLGLIVNENKLNKYLARE